MRSIWICLALSVLHSHHGALLGALQLFSVLTSLRKKLDRLLPFIEGRYEPKMGG